MQNVIWDWMCTYSDRRQSGGGEVKAQKNTKIKEQNALTLMFEQEKTSLISKATPPPSHMHTQTQREKKILCDGAMIGMFGINKSVSNNNYFYR